MNYFDVYKKKLNSKGGNVVNALKGYGENFVIDNFKDDPNYRLATKVDSEFYEDEIDIRIENVDRTVTEKKIIFLPNAEVSEGDYISFDDKTYIIDEVEYNALAPFGKSKYCNQKLKWYGLDKEIPCHITNDAYGSKTLLDNAMLSNTDTKAKITVQNNKYTRQIKRDWRFIFNNSEYDIFKVTDITTSMDDGFITLITKKDKMMVEDDIANNLAYIQDLKVDIIPIVIDGSNIIKFNTTQEYTVNQEGLTFEIDDETIATIVSQDNTKCTIKALLKDEMFILNAKNNNGDIVTSLIITTTR